MRFDLSPRASTRAHEMLRSAKLPFLEWWAARHLATGAPRARIPIVPHAEPAATAAHTVRVIKRRGRIVALAAGLDFARSRLGFSTLQRRLGVFLRLLSAPSVPDGDWWVDCSDTVRDEGPYLGFCSAWRQTLLVPDRGFITKRGYAAERRAGRAAPPFAERDPAIVWRGSPTGLGQFVADPFDAANPVLKQRVRMCLRLRDRPRTGPEAVDVRFACGRALEAPVTARYREAGILGEFVPQRSWCRRRFAIDVDGYGNAFSNLFIRLLYGCCVIRVASPAGFRQWYHERLEPGRHYVSVAADLSDLDDVIDWCHREPAACAAIARAGQAVAMAMTFPEEIQRTLTAIRDRGPSDARPRA